MYFVMPACKQHICVSLCVYIALSVRMRVSSCIYLLIDVAICLQECFRRPFMERLLLVSLILSIHLSYVCSVAWNSYVSMACVHCIHVIGYQVLKATREPRLCNCFHGCFEARGAWSLESPAVPRWDRRRTLGTGHDIPKPIQAAWERQTKM